MSVNHEVRDVLPSYIPVKIFTCFLAAFQLARQQHTWVTYLLFFPTHFTRCKSRACVYLWSKHGICWCYSCSVININCIYAHFRRKTKERDKDIGHGMWKVCQPGLLRRWWRRERKREKKITRKRKNGNKYTGGKSVKLFETKSPILSNVLVQNKKCNEREKQECKYQWDVFTL